MCGLVLMGSFLTAAGLLAANGKVYYLQCLNTPFIG